MSWSFQKIGETALPVLAIGILIVFVLLWFRRIHDKSVLIARLVGTALLLLIMNLTAIKMFKTGGLAAIGGLFLTVAIGWILAIIWVPAVTGYVGKLFGSLYDGGDAEAEPRPFYSVFNSKRNQGKYFEALAEIRRQLDKFPADFEGMMLLAQLQAEHLNDLPGAEITIHRLCGQPGHAPLNIAAALNHLADWHLGLTKDRDGARQALEKIVELMPDTDMSLRAQQRIAHLADTGMLLAPHDRQRISVAKGVENLGLLREGGKLQPPREDLAQTAADYVEHLEKHPLDGHAREKLAVLYAKHYQRLDLAMDQLEQLVQQPNQPPKQVVHWLNLMADLQVHLGADFEQVRGTLQRIIDQYPDMAGAENARRRLEVLKLELKGKEKSQSVELGTYEQNLGLKERS